MDTFCVIFKTIGDYFLPLAGLVVASCAVSPRLGKWFKQREAAVRESRLKRGLFGFVLAAFCLALIGTTARIQLMQATDQKQQAIERSPIYQSQIVLKDHLTNFVNDLSDFAKHYDQDPNRDVELYETYMPEIRTYISKLRDEGVRSTNFDKLISGGQMPMPVYVSNIAAELGKMAAQLPIMDKNP